MDGNIFYDIFTSVMTLSDKVLSIISLTLNDIFGISGQIGNVSLGSAIFGITVVTILGFHFLALIIPN